MMSGNTTQARHVSASTNDWQTHSDDASDFNLYRDVMRGGMLGGHGVLWEGGAVSAEGLVLPEA